MLTIKQRRKTAMRQIDWILSHWRDIRQAIIAARIDRNTSVDENIGGGRSSITSDPTARDAIANVTKIDSVILPTGEEVDNPEQWIDVIRTAYRQCDNRQRVVFQARYFHGLNPTAIAVRHDIPRSTCFSILGGIRRIVFELALQYNLILII